jgi:hypothetical protein
MQNYSLYRQAQQPRAAPGELDMAPLILLVSAILILLYWPTRPDQMAQVDNIAIESSAETKELTPDPTTFRAQATPNNKM